MSYPKSGNTWTRFLIGNLIYEGGVDFSNIEIRVPDIYANSDAILGHLADPRIIKSHEYFDPRYKKVIYIVRDPRDVVVSYISFARKHRLIPDNYPVDEFVEQFLKGELDPYGSWSENVGSWIGARIDNPNFLLLKYENMLINPKVELNKVAAFLSLDVDENRIQKAIELSGFERMKQLEKIQSSEWVATKKSRKDIPFMRAGGSGNWRSELTAHSAERIKDVFAGTMEQMGYR